MRKLSMTELGRKSAKEFRQSEKMPISMILENRPETGREQEGTVQLQCKISEGYEDREFEIGSVEKLRV